MVCKSVSISFLRHVHHACKQEHSAMRLGGNILHHSVHGIF